MSRFSDINTQSYCNDWSFDNEHWKDAVVQYSMAGLAAAAPPLRNTIRLFIQEQTMKQLLKRMWREDDGVLSFEWVLLVTLLTIGIVSGLAGARDAIIDELGDLAEAAQGIDQSYTLSGLTLDLTINGIPFTGTAAPSSFQETAADTLFTDCGRTNFTGGQGVVTDSPS